MLVYAAEDSAPPQPRRESMPTTNDNASVLQMFMIVFVRFKVRLHCYEIERHNDVRSMQIVIIVMLLFIISIALVCM